MNINGIEFVKHKDGYWVPMDNNYIKNILDFSTCAEAVGKAAVLSMETEDDSIVYALCDADDANAMTALETVRAQLSISTDKEFLLHFCLGKGVGLGVMF